MGRNRKQTLVDATPQDQAIRNQILRTAAKLLQEVGYQRTTLSRISEVSGVGPTELRHWYRTKDEILAALTEQLLTRSQEVMEKELAPSEILLKENPKEMLALYQYIIPLAIALEAMDASAILCSIYKTMYTTPRLFEMLVDRHASYAHLTFAHEFRYLFPREQLKRLILTQALEIFDVPPEKTEMVLVELETQREKMLEVGKRIFQMV